QKRRSGLRRYCQSPLWQRRRWQFGRNLVPASLEHKSAEVDFGDTAKVRFGSAGVGNSAET
ncbi:MAG: hypothetical protein K9H23_23655, partial [Saprospiraceae bacterium]|nr:hypothetical protein [Saprospiraceae bacterium]